MTPKERVEFLVKDLKKTGFKDEIVSILLRSMEWEREECAKICEGWATCKKGVERTANEHAELIRKRSTE